MSKHKSSAAAFISRIISSRNFDIKNMEVVKHLLLQLTTFLFRIPQIIQLSHANWGTPGSGQYHIQTDEGPERFFRYQTDSGQFRKEKRLKDGTVIGTNAWIDGFGYLRQNDYM